MKKLLIILTLISAFCSFTFAQSLLAEIEKVKEIKLLESTRDDVRRILADYRVSRLDINGYVEGFSKEDSYFSITYTTGDCSDDPEEWKVPEWKVAVIEISPKTPFEIEKSGFDLTGFKKERHYANYPESYIYHNLDTGFLLEINENLIKRIFIIPPRSKSSLLCSQKFAKKYYYGKSIFRDSKLKDRVLNVHPVTGVSELNLSSEEITANCTENALAENKSCSGSSREIFVITVSDDPQSDDILVFRYKVSGGKIIGTGAKVIWDLSGVKPGTYTITAGVDDGCGVCGKPMTKTVMVRQCADCPR